MKINKLGIPVKALLVILAVCIANACENANEVALQESFEERLLLNKKQVKDYVSSIGDLSFSRYSAYEDTEGFFADAKSRLSIIDPQANSEFIAKVEQHYEAKKAVEADLLKHSLQTSAIGERYWVGIAENEVFSFRRIEVTIFASQALRLQ